VPRGQSKSRWRISIGPKAHMAAYKRPVTVQVKREATELTPHHKHLRIFSLHSVRVKIHKTQKSSRTRRTIPQTLTFSKTKFKHNAVKFTTVLRDSSTNRHHRTISSAIQAWTHHWKRQTQRDHRGRRLRRRRRRNYRFIFGSKPRINKTESKSKVHEDSSSNLRLKRR